MKKIVLCLLIGIGISLNVEAGQTYNAYIKQIQVEGIGDPYNTVHLDYDVTDSPCSSTNSANRFEIANNAQQSAVLAALLAGKKVTLYASGNCNVGNIEILNYVMLKASE